MRTGIAASSRARLALVVLLGSPALVLFASYALLAVRHGRWNLFPVVVHESGRYTLTETIFYFRHFVRELPVNTFVAFAVGILAVQQGPMAAGLSQSRRKTDVIRRLAGLGALAIPIIALGMTWHQIDRRETWIELAQYRTRDELSEFGSHWRYHLLHVADSFLFSHGLLLMARGFAGLGSSSRGMLRWVTVWIVLFGLITLGFGAPLRSLTDPLYLAHQAREIETHRLLTLCPAVGCILWLDHVLGAACDLTTSGLRTFWRGVMWIVLATFIPVWIFLMLRHADLPALAGRRVDLWQLAAAHHFEHVLDAIYVVALSTWVYLGFLHESSPQHDT